MDIDKTRYPTGHLRWKNGKLQQEWRVTKTSGTGSDRWFEWKDVPTVNPEFHVGN